MSTTRIPAELSAHVCLAGERPCLFIDCGCWRGKIHFDDCVELRALLRDAVRHRHLPAWAASKSHVYALRVMGSYEEPGRDVAPLDGLYVKECATRDAPGRSIYRRWVTALAAIGWAWLALKAALWVIGELR